MKNAILISGSAGSGKTFLAGKIKRQFTRPGFMDAQDPKVHWLAPGTDVVMVGEITSASQLEHFLGHISAQPLLVDKKKGGTFTVSPFFIFISQQVRLLPGNLQKHFAHVDCYQGGACPVDLQGLPENVVQTICRHAENPSNYRRPGATAPIKTGVYYKSPKK